MSGWGFGSWGQDLGNSVFTNSLKIPVVSLSSPASALPKNKDVDKKTALPPPQVANIRFEQGEPEHLFLPADLIIQVCFVMNSAQDMVSFGMMNRRYYHVVLRNIRNEHHKTSQHLLLPFVQQTLIHEEVVSFEGFSMLPALMISLTLPNGWRHGLQVRYAVGRKLSEQIPAELENLTHGKQTGSPNDLAQLVDIFKTRGFIRDEEHYYFGLPRSTIKYKARFQIELQIFYDTNGLKTKAVKDATSSGFWTPEAPNRTTMLFTNGNKNILLEFSRSGQLTSRRTSSPTTGAPICNEKFSKNPASDDFFLQTRWSCNSGGYESIEKWHANGTLAFFGTTKQIGIDTTWLPTGILKQRIGCTMLKNGSALSSESAKVRHGLTQIYYEDGTLQSEERYFIGRKHGLAERFDETGKLISRKQFNMNIDIAKYNEGTLMTPDLTEKLHRKLKQHKEAEAMESAWISWGDPLDDFKI